MKNKILLILLGIFLISLVHATGMPDPYGDYDSDGVLNKDDNCYYVYNPFQTDSDGDGWGNCCDSDYSKPEEVNWCDDPNQNQGYCGNCIIEGDEQCDDGDNNGVVCDNSTSSCYYCSSECELVFLPYEQEPPVQNKTTKPKSSHKNHFVIGGCEPNWECTGWSECSNGFRTRNCHNTNNCAYSYNKPIERTGCEADYVVLKDTKQTPFSFKSLYDPKNPVLTLIVVLIIGVIVELFAIAIIRRLR